MFYFIYELLLLFFIWYVLIVFFVNFMLFCKFINFKFCLRNLMNQIYFFCKQFFFSKGYRGFIDREFIFIGNFDVVFVQNLGYYNKVEGQSKYRNVQKEKLFQEEEVGGYFSFKMFFNFFYVIFLQFQRIGKFCYLMFEMYLRL